MNLPTKITTARLVLIPIIIITFCLESLFDWMFIVTEVLFFIASTTDFIDGYIARKYQMVTTLGKFLDPIADKALTLTGLVIGIANCRIGIPYFMEICTIIIVVREFIVSLLRQIAASKNVILAADKLGKMKTMTGMVGLNALIFVPFMDWDNKVAINFGTAFRWIAIVGISLTTILAVISGFNYVFKNLNVFKEEKSTVEKISENKDYPMPDENIINVLKACVQEKRCDVPFIQKIDNIGYYRALKIAVWIEVMGFSKVEDNKRVLNMTEEDIQKIEANFKENK